MSAKFNPLDLVRDNINALSPYSSARDEFEKITTDYVFLDANENPNENNYNRYPDPHHKLLKEKIAEINNIQPSQILLGNGSDEILDIIFRTFCTPTKDSVITLPPTYGMYKVLAGINDVAYKQILLDDDFQPNVSKILAQAIDTKLLFICSPNNPTGNIIKRNRILELLNAYQGIIVIDEAYIEFAESDSWVSMINQHPNLIVTKTLSKAHAMAGLRLGICISNPEIINILTKIKPPYNINTLTQKTALDKLCNSTIHEEVAQIVAQRNSITKALESVSFIKNIYPSDANFILIKVDDADHRYQQLTERGIIIRNRTKEPLCSNTLRITVGTASENTQLITALQSIS